MDVLLSFLYCMMWIGIGAVAMLSIIEGYEAHKRKHKKGTEETKAKVEERKIPPAPKDDGKLKMHITFSDGSIHGEEIAVSRKTSPFRVKVWRRMYRWFFTKATPLFTMRTKNSITGSIDYFTFRRENMKTIRFFWQANE